MRTNSQVRIEDWPWAYELRRGNASVSVGYLDRGRGLINKINYGDGERLGWFIIDEPVARTPEQVAEIARRVLGLMHVGMCLDLILEGPRSPYLTLMLEFPAEGGGPQ